MNESVLSRLSLAISGYQGAGAIRIVLEDWIEFLGGRPAEIVYVDGGSGAQTLAELEGLKAAGLIDTLHLTPADAWENHRDRCYIQEHRSGALCTKELVLFVKLDTLAFRRGMDGWLAEEAAALDDPGVFAISLPGAPAPISRCLGMRGAYQSSDFVSLCYALMKRSEFDRACREQMGEFIDSGFRGEYPAQIAARPEIPPGLRRALVELLWTEHCRRHGLVALARPQSLEYQINHVNIWGADLLPVRDAFRRRDDVERLVDEIGPYNGPRRPVRRLISSLEGVVRAMRIAVGLRKARRKPVSLGRELRAMGTSLVQIVVPSFGQVKAGDGEPDSGDHSMMRTKSMPINEQVEAAARSAHHGGLLAITAVLGTRGVDVVFDVGANEGQSVDVLLKLFPSASIHAVEPGGEAFGKLQAKYARAPRVRTHRLGLGDTQGELTLHRHKGSVTDSLLPDGVALSQVAPAELIGALAPETVPVWTLDRLARENSIARIDVLKIDTQGYDDRVLAGAAGLLGSGAIRAVQVEVIFSELYEGQATFDAMFARLAGAGFRFVGLFNPERGAHGALEWCDAVFVHASTLR
ncbi:MAG: FkbM family methyltransferase [Planctomycetota bacterium]